MLSYLFLNKRLRNNRQKDWYYRSLLCLEAVMIVYILIFYRTKTIIIIIRVRA